MESIVPPYLPQSSKNFLALRESLSSAKGFGYEKENDRMTLRSIFSLPVAVGLAIIGVEYGSLGHYRHPFARPGH